VDRQRPKEPRSALAQKDKETAISFPAVRPRTSALRPGTPGCSKRSPTPATSAVPKARRGSRFTRALPSNTGAKRRMRLTSKD
jgi:hypothetical protein